MQVLKENVHLCEARLNVLKIIVYYFASIFLCQVKHKLSPLDFHPLLMAKAKTLLARISLWEIMFSILHVFCHMRQTISVY